MYEIKNIKGFRKYFTKHIILCQAKNLFPTNSPLDVTMTRGNRRYTWGDWQKYFMTVTYKFRNPCHFFTEFLDNDYVIYSGLGINERSYFIDELIELGCLNREYRDCIFILIQEDLEIDQLEDRFYEQLCSKIISPLMVEYSIPRSNINYIDDILNIGWEQKQLRSDIDFGITKANYFNPVKLTTYINKYRKLS